MDSVVGSSCYSLFFSNSSLPCFSKPLSTQSSTTNAHKQKRLNPTMVSTNQDCFNGTQFCRRKAIIFLGFAALPLLRLKAQASEAEVQADSVLQTNRANGSQNFFFSLLNDLGIVGVGVLGALYAIAQKEKDALDANIELVRSELLETDTNIRKMEKKYESEFLIEKQIRSKQIKEGNDNKQSLVDQVTMSNSIIAKQGKELQEERQLAYELKAQIDSLQLNLKEATEDRLELQGKLKETLDSIEVLLGRTKLIGSEIRSKEDNIEALSTTIAEKERSYSDLSFSYQQAEDKKKVFEYRVKELKDEEHGYKMELEIKNTAIDSLNAELTSLLAEKEALNENFDIIQNQYNNLKNSSAEKEASDAKLLQEQRQKVDQLEKQLVIAENEDIIDKVVIYDLTQERNDLKTMLDSELINKKNLEHELQVTEDSLRKSMGDSLDLENQFQQSRDLCSELEDVLSKANAEFSEERESLQMSISYAKHNAENLASQLASVKDLLNQKVEELETISQEVDTVSEMCDRMEKDLMIAMKKAEIAIHALKEEKDNFISLSNELKNLETEMSKDKQAVKSLEANLEEATRSLGGSNQNVLTLSKDIELINSRISSLEDENDILQGNIVEQKQISQEAREYLEDAHNRVMRLGKERETLEKKGEKLEEKLASAKSEILRLRSQKVYSRSPVDNQNQQKRDSDYENVVPAKKTTRRRRVSPPRNNS